MTRPDNHRTTPAWSDDDVQSAAVQDVDRGSWLGPPLDCNYLLRVASRIRGHVVLSRRFGGNYQTLV